MHSQNITISIINRTRLYNLFFIYISGIINKLNTQMNSHLQEQVIQMFVDGTIFYVPILCAITFM